ncbi:hypothetical protein BJ944DRAFT_171283, partial [Cunninghamella echinulata]
ISECSVQNFLIILSFHSPIVNLTCISWSRMSYTTPHHYISTPLYFHPMLDC